MAPLYFMKQIPFLTSISGTGVKSTVSIVVEVDIDVVNISSSQR